MSEACTSRQYMPSDRRMAGSSASAKSTRRLTPPCPDTLAPICPDDTRERYLGITRPRFSRGRFGAGRAEAPLRRRTDLMRRRLCLAALGGLLALPLSGATALGRTTATPAAHAASTSPGVLFNREIFQYKTSQTTAAQAARYSVVVLNAADAPHIATLRAENPHILIFMYQSALQSQTADPTGITTCTPYGTDNTSHPTWFLTDPLLRRIYDKGYPTNYLMDVGNPAYQQACISHADQQAQAL